MSTTFKIGDIVRLKSGGPDMTVTSVGQRHEESSQISAWCTWFPAPDSRKTEVLPIEALDLVERV